MQLTALPDDAGGAVRELRQYDWQSRGRSGGVPADPGSARQGDAGPAVRRHETGDAAGHARRTSSGFERCWTSSTSCWPHMPRARTPPSSSPEFMDRARRVLPGEPADRSTELIDLLAARAAAAQRLVNSMSDEQRAELAELSQQAFGDPRLGAGARPAGLRAAAAAARRGLVRIRPVLRIGADGAGRGHPGDRRSSAGWTHWPSSCRRVYRGARLEDIDLDELAAALGEPARVDVRRLAELERELKERGLLRAGRRWLAAAVPAGAASARGVGAAVISPTGWARRGERETRRSGAAANQPARPGRGRSATPKPGACRARCSTPSCVGPVVTTALLDVSDVEIMETEQRTSRGGSTVRRHLLVDGAGRSLGADEADRVGAAPVDLDQVPQDACSSSPSVAERSRSSWPNSIGLEGAYVQGTNLHHALMLAGEHLRSQPDALPVRAGGHRRRADGPSGAGRRARVLLPARPATRCEPPRRVGPAGRRVGPRSASSSSATTPDWRPSSTRSPGAVAAG